LRLGVDLRGHVPAIDPDLADVWITTAAHAPRPWVCVPLTDTQNVLARLHRRIETTPLAAATLARVLRASEGLPFDDALCIESLAYSTLLGGIEFRAWRSRTAVRSRPEPAGARVELVRRGDDVHVRLTRPARRNAFDARMRDELCEALQFTLDDDSVRRVHLGAEGPAFSAGGDLDEFGTTTDLAFAHAVRLARSPARLVHAQAARVTAHLHGACVGAGIEVPAAAGRVLAGRSAWFRLPELDMGLIPGAGGTVTLPRRIGRHRTFFWALCDTSLDVATALQWGLVDEITEPKEHAS
jgi:enoyl-CoA hydratase/carnithine racemase